MFNRKGFTLIELLIVVVIIGILAAIAIPNFLTYQLKSRQSEARTNLGGIRSSESSHNGLFGCYMAIAPIAGGTTGAAVPGAAKAIPVAWTPAVATVVPPGTTWCQAAGPNGGSLGVFTDIGFAATGNVFFSYGVDTLAAPVAPAVTAACMAGGQGLATGANGDAPAPGSYRATAGANLDGAANGGEVFSDFGVSDGQSVTMCSSPSTY
jgi:type IV pilus assembly protein PilA